MCQLGWIFHLQLYIGFCGEHNRSNSMRWLASIHTVVVLTLSQDIDECLGAGSACDHCQNEPGSYSCVCDPGFVLESDGLTCSGLLLLKRSNLTPCSDVNECLTNNGGCDILVTCTNLNGTFACGDCPEGFAYEDDNVTCRSEIQLSLVH